jgi:hypothetical protein
MKIKNYFSLAAMSLAVAGFVSCAQNDNPILPDPDPEVPEPEEIVFPKGDFELVDEITDLSEATVTPFVIVNQAEMKALYGPSAQNLVYGDLADALSKDNANFGFKLVPVDEVNKSRGAAGVKAKENRYLLRAMTPDGKEYSIWGQPGYLNAQPLETGWCCFILGLGDDFGQDFKNGAVWDLKFEEGQGFALRNVGTRKYLSNAGNANQDEPTYFKLYTYKAEGAEEAQGTKVYIYGGPDNPEQAPFSPAAWDAAAMRFSSTEGAHLPTISDEVYFGLKTLILDVSDASDNCTMRVMNGWWSTTYYDNVKIVSGLNEIQITQAMADECAKGGQGRDLDLMLTDGSMKLNSVYYVEE